ncbi:division/cell wall cluster transcriptional repressor MraZ [Planctomycetota bacterium]
MFSGKFEHSLDPKDRVIVPAPLRAHLDEKHIVLSRGQERCLYLYTKTAWRREVLAGLRASDRPYGGSRRDRDALRALQAHTHVLEPDKQGRIQIPTELKRFARLDRTVVFLGVIDRIEVWAKETWKEDDVDSDEKFDQLAASAFGRCSAQPEENPDQRESGC